MSDFERRLSELANGAGGAARLRAGAELRRIGKSRQARRRAVGTAILAAAIAASLTAVAYRVQALNPAPPQPASSSAAMPRITPTGEPSEGPSDRPTFDAEASVGPTPLPGTVNCPLASFEITIGGNGRPKANAGHISIPLVLRNVGSTKCSMTGYLTVEPLDSAGREVNTLLMQNPSGFMGGLGGIGRLSVVHLAPGEVASALFEALEVNWDGTPCVPFAALRLALPRQQDSVTIPWGLAGCGDPQIHPFVSGESGQG